MPISLKCNVCGMEFHPLKERHYISSAFADNDLKLYDSFDCPCCGCQVAVQQRKFRFTSIPEPIMRESHSVHVECCEAHNAQSGKVTLNFDSLDLAQTALNAILDFANKHDFVSIADINRIFGRTSGLYSRWGWNNLSKAKIVSTSNRYYISFPAICDRHIW